MARVPPLGDYLDDPDRLFLWLHQAVFGVATMNLANSSGLTARLLEGPADLADLASVTGVPADKLARILAYLQAQAIIDLSPDGTWVATSRTQAMQQMAWNLANQQLSSQAAGRLLEALREGRVPFELAFGEPVFEYFAKRPERAALFGGFMGWMTARVTRFLFAQHRFNPFETVCDIGGSMGDLLLAVLAEYPGTRGVLFDLPGTVEIAGGRLAGNPLAERIELVAGDFFAGVPVADLYTMKQILHDWDDAEATAILASVRRAIPPHGRLVVIDHLLEDVPVADEGQGTDIAMMIWATGRERKLGEFAALFAASGFAIDRVSRNPAGHSALEVVPV